MVLQGLQGAEGGIGGTEDLGVDLEEVAVFFQGDPEFVEPVHVRGPAVFAEAPRRAGSGGTQSAAKRGEKADSEPALLKLVEIGGSELGAKFAGRLRQIPARLAS